MKAQAHVRYGVAPRRLLPGDQAPALKLARIFGPNVAHPPTFDRLSIVLLWNAGCANCMQAIENISTFAHENDVPVYAVAIMVRDEAATLDATAFGPSSVMYALEAKDPRPSRLMRGWVTRNWAEASGQLAVPAGFIIDGANTVSWLGNPFEMKPVLQRCLKGTWNVEGARTAALVEQTNEDFHKQRVIRDLTDYVVSGDTTFALSLIEKLDEEFPDLKSDKEYTSLKLSVLASLPEKESEALCQYTQASGQYPQDIPFQIRMAGVLLAHMSHNRAAMDMLASRLEIAASGDIGDNDVGRIRLLAWVALLRAESMLRLDRVVEADACLLAAKSYADHEGLSAHLRSQIYQRADELVTARHAITKGSGKAY